MVDSALQEFWRLIGLQVLPSGENDQSVEIEGVGTIRVARRGEAVLLSGFLEAIPGREEETMHRLFARTDYRHRGAGRLHPALSADGRWGYLAFLSGDSLTGTSVLAAFESLGEGLQAASGLHNVL